VIAVTNYNPIESYVRDVTSRLDLWCCRYRWVCNKQRRL